MSDDILSEFDDLDSKDLENPENIVNVLMGSATFPSDSTPSRKTMNVEDLDESDIDEYVVKQTATIIENVMGVVESMSENPDSFTYDAKALEGYNGLVNAATSAVASLNKIKLEKSKLKQQKELKQIDINSREKIALNREENNKQTIKLTREEFIALMSDKNDNTDNTDNDSIKTIDV
jgi:hypothetical protein